MTKEVFWQFCFCFYLTAEKKKKGKEKNVLLNCMTSWAVFHVPH